MEARNNLGKALSLIGMWMFINIVGLMVALGAGAIDPNSELLASNGLLGTQNSSLITGYVNNYNDINGWTFNNTLKTQLPQGSATQTGTTSTTAFPDWINSSLNWISTIMSVLLNVIGAPYTLLMFMLGGCSVVAVIGIGLSIINLFVLVNWIFGKVD